MSRLIRVAVMVSCCAFAVISGGCGAAPSAPTPASGAHDVDSLLKVLQAEGVTVERAGAVHHPFLSVGGQVVLVNDQTVEAFQYSSAGALLADTANIGAGGCIGTIGGGMDDPWTGPPHLYKSAGLLVIYVGSDATVLRALVGALGPQFKGK
jgi:hypothetical protein